eukprot:CAMPEP_0195511854 /NCGR_PEP_ID=MMETSP0794_2-20130614/4022_1 /TAXON_ID=515487 /ORGANISM="Stephanopyxis turris, Strain CCMP 815" /LENGTH=370 /DNA_ID=CAMNT_0040639525 /DNA_START=36 /DNA_END=1148 /DNA_ORIENTATION=+
MVSLSCFRVRQLGIAVASLFLPTTTGGFSDDTQWPNACSASGNDYNSTRCPSDATCCQNKFSGNGWGCCPWSEATCCPNGYACCPKNTQCVEKTEERKYLLLADTRGSSSLLRRSLATTPSFNTVYDCVTNGVVIEAGKGVCKPGPALPLDENKKNVLIIGDSVSIGYTPLVASALGSEALVQHSPWDVSDGGAEETSYGLQCLDYFLRSPGGSDLRVDVLTFNWGLHDMGGAHAVPGQEESPDSYKKELSEIAEKLKSWATNHGTKILFVMTSPMMCDVDKDQTVQSLNNEAKSIMQRFGIQTLDVHKPIVDKCGPVPSHSCFDYEDCFCPHCGTAGYEFIANTTIAPAITSLYKPTSSAEDSSITSTT